MDRTNCNLEIWMSFIQAKYLKDATTYEGKCPTCKSPKDCNNYYCVQCKEGGLCPMAFRADGEHHHHRWLQVLRESRHCAVDPKELAAFIGTETTNHIKTCTLNGGTLCYLTRTNIPEPNNTPIPQSKTSESSSKRARIQPVTKLKACSGCTRWIPNSSNCKEEFLVCCLQCLITVAQREPERNLLVLKDGALNLTDLFPQTALEKTGGSPKPCGQFLASTSTAQAVVAGVDVVRCSGASDGKHSGADSIAAATAYHDDHDLLLIAEAEFASSRNKRRMRIRRQLGLPAQEQRDGDAQHVSQMVIDQPESSSAAPSDVAITISAPSRRDGDLHLGESSGGSRAGGSGGSGGAEPPAAVASEEFQAPDYSAYPHGYRSAGLFTVIGAIESIGDWDQILGDAGTD